jgi:hypothetical protein
VVVIKSSNKTTPTIGKRDFFLIGNSVGNMGVTSIID